MGGLIGGWFGLGGYNELGGRRQENQPVSCFTVVMRQHTLHSIHFLLSNLEDSSAHDRAS